MNIKSKLLLLIVFLILPLNVFASNENLSEEFQTDLYVAKVIEVLEIKEINDTKIQTLEIEILSDKYEGSKDTITNTLTGGSNDIELSEGDKINVVATTEGDEVSFYFHSFEKSNYLILLIIIFMLFVIILGKIKGLKALISLIITILLILFGLIPLLLKGYSPVLLSVVTCILSTVLTFVITNGFTKKTLVAIIGVVGGLVLAGLIATIFSSIMHLTGVASESEQMLYYLQLEFEFDFKGLLFAGIIIGALGACMDVAMELTSSLTEIKSHNPKISDKKLIKSGFNIGKDIMGTMVNTLILAYTGSSLSTILLFVGFEKSVSEIINLESISTEIIRAIAGSIGLLASIPITIFVFILINKKGKTKDEENI